MRLIHTKIRAIAAPMGIRFNGEQIAAVTGETIAAALSAAGHLAFRETASGAPRGLWCGMGACFDCLVTVDGRANQRACMVKVADGMQVASAVPARPAPLATPPISIPERAVDLLVIGAGPAGLSAAVAAAEAGVRVLVLDERDAPGGQYLKPLAPGHVHAAPDAQFRRGAALFARAARAGVEILQGATAWGGFSPAPADWAANAETRPPGLEIAAIIQGAAETLRPRLLVIAAGAHECPVPVPGWTLPGVMTTGAMQTLARAQRVSPAAKVVIAGNGPLNLQLACELLAGGVEVAAVVEAAPAPGAAVLLRMAAASPSLAWDGARYLARLRAAGVPVLWNTEVLACEGTDRFQALRVRGPGGEQRIAAGACALTLGFQPETGLARALGCAHRFIDQGLGRLETETDPEGRTSIEGIFAVGDGAALGGARAALARGRLAGLAAARALGHHLPEDRATERALARAERFQAALWQGFAAPAFNVAAIADATIVCRCEEVTAGALRAAGRNASLPGLKKATRAGMGRCQGRMCAATIARLTGTSAEAGFAAPRAPIKPVPAAALRHELPEWSASPIVAAPAPIAWRSHRTAETPPATAEFVIIGGGVVGLATALYLAREGREVVLLERDEPGLAASTANAGSLHVQLLSYDFGEVADAAGTAGPAADTLSLGPASIALWHEIARDGSDTLGIRQEGGLMLAETEAEFAWLRGKTALERARGIETHLLGANELHALAPHLGVGFLGAAFCPTEGQIDPLRGTTALAAQARAAGVRIVTGADVAALAPEGNSWAVTTGSGRLRAGRVINAAGPWAGRIAALAGMRLPVKGAVQQVVITEAAPPILRHLVAHAGRHLSLKQSDAGHMVIGGAWPGDQDAATGATRNRRRSIEGNLWVAGHVAPAINGLHVLRAWTGLNVALDRAPLVGEHPAAPGLIHAVTGNGYTLGPVVARMAADAALGRGAPPPAFSPTRFTT
ncbi:glycine/D-amino acid oxidase-like deaminating enzyme [Humitalea rosea]|uniref:Glycine/D-amino acid oxidase-like deaminating enzyme n=1 Tax=Humitalea rosea TaxID=990373 RepID=A0A2W7J4C2_9PROT|nr:FAD-dependent oxidoreductase [Humitalea rosea]PZW45923.1 glycine/D-amino acid oxidase-like deaminating enzyme [Humitalea rosea]